MITIEEPGSIIQNLLVLGFETDIGCLSFSGVTYNLGGAGHGANL
jgi:hypothetical protein